MYETLALLQLPVLLGLLLTATVTDVREHKIYNWNTYPGMLAGLAFHTIAAGWPGLQFAGIGFVTCGLIMVICFVLFNIGGGDVKLVAMMGAFLGLQKGVEALLWTFILGSAMGVAILIWRFGVWHLLRKAVEHLKLVWQAKGWIAPTPEEREPLQRWLFLAPAALLATLIVVGKPWLRRWGIAL